LGGIGKNRLSLCFLCFFGGLGSSAPKTKAYVALKDAASRSKSLRLASVAAAVRMSAAGHFDKVIEKIDEMIATLQEEAAEDLKQRDDCKKQYHDLAQQKAEIEWLIKKNEAAIVKIEGKIEKVESSIKETEDAMGVTRKELEDMLKDRTDENDEFKAAKTADEKAIEMIEQAIEVLSAYYKDNKIELGPIQGSAKGFIQEPEFDKGDQPPDAEFKKKGHKKNQSKGIISILTMIKEDLQDEIKNGIKNEEAAQAALNSSFSSVRSLSISSSSFLVTPIASSVSLIEDSTFSIFPSIFTIAASFFLISHSISAFCWARSWYCFLQSSRCFKSSAASSCKVAIISSIFSMTLSKWPAALMRTAAATDARRRLLDREAASLSATYAFVFGAEEPRPPKKQRKQRLRRFLPMPPKSSMTRQNS
jgi:hypothetical protein